MKKGDTLIYLRHPTDEEWKVTGKITPTLIPGKEYKITEIHSHIENIVKAETDYWYPVCVFQLNLHYEIY